MLCNTYTDMNAHPVRVLKTPTLTLPIVARTDNAFLHYTRFTSRLYLVTCLS